MSETLRPDRVDRIQDEWRVIRPDLDTSPQGVIGRLHRVALALTAELTAVYTAHGLSEAEFDLLASLRRRGGALPAGELAAHTMVTTGGLTKRVDRLIERGLVERSPVHDDGRVRLIRLTDAGTRLIDAAFTDHMRNEHRLVAMLEPGDATALTLALRHWMSHLGD